jgi:diadenosine tetraphosphatase ApaH/serine/threonine PP2A family protein phosphatase
MLMSERVAIISDIHANLDALEAVLADLEAQGATEVLCLGDIVGYGLDAEACVDRVRRRCSVCLCGNHDWAMTHDAVGFNNVARQAIDLTRRRMKPGRWATRAARRRWAYVDGLPQREERHGWLLVHGSPRDPVTEYVFPEDVDMAPDKIEDILGRFERTCFVGHTHLPGVFTEAIQFFPPGELTGGFHLSSGKALVNVGSVGQPRDGDWRACYVLVGDDRVVYRRVAYDVQRTMERIRASRLEPLSAERLPAGK